jgi:pyrroloquinoline quinone biosynthesis protein B
VRWRTLRPGVEVPLTCDDGAGPHDSGLFVTAFAVPGKRPLHLEGLAPPAEHDNVDNVGLRIRDAGTGRTLAYLSACGGMGDGVKATMAGADLVFFDGTFWTNDEMVTGGLGTRRAADMAHWPVGGPEGSLAFLAAERACRRVLIHVNNSNPLLRDDSPERAAVAAAGVEVAFDGMEGEV